MIDTIGEFIIGIIFGAIMPFFAYTTITDKYESYLGKLLGSTLLLLTPGLMAGMALASENDKLLGIATLISYVPSFVLFINNFLSDK